MGIAKASWDGRNWGANKSSPEQRLSGIRDCDHHPDCARDVDYALLQSSA